MDESPRDDRDLARRLLAFAVRIVRLCQKLSEKPGVGRTICHQLVRAGTSIGANYEEGQGAQSRADFVSKNCIALKEARETHYWLRLIAESQMIAPDLLTGLTDEAGQIVKILGSIVARTRKNTG